MILSKLLIFRSSHFKTLSGSIEFENEDAKVSLNLNDKQCNDILLICADALVESSKEVAKTLTANIINQTKRIEANQ